MLNQQDKDDDCNQGPIVISHVTEQNSVFGLVSEEEMISIEA